MSFWKKKADQAIDVDIMPEDQAATGTAADVEAVMKKYDRESNTRIWEGVPKQVIRFIMAIFSVYCIVVTLTGVGLPEQRLTRFVAGIIIIGYLNFPINKKHVRVNSLPWYDIVLMVLGAFPFLYFSFNAKEILLMDYIFVSTDPFMLGMAVIAILCTMELCRRCVGLPILCVVAALLIYAFANVRFGKVLYDLFYTVSGVLGTPINACQKYIVVFIIFGAFLERTGISQFFINLANSVAGASSGGPAKVAVISSALCGMVSGSSVGNTVTTGSVTIPMMKKTGYKGEFAGAVEAAASTGGQIMPPIMGAAAFLMAEYTGVAYPTIALLAILPAVLYFGGIYVAVHLEAKKMGLKGIPKDQLPKFKNLVKKIYLLLPLVVLVVLVSTGARTMQSSAALAILVAIAVGIINRDDRITVSKAIDALEAGSKGTITVAVACAMAGIIAGCITTTGLASTLLRAIVAASGGVPLLALFLTMLCCIVLGMGVPTTANYCIMAATCAPILMSPEIGVPMLAAHFFVFYFGIVADITPPVALAAYAGSAIAKSNPMKTAVNATRLAIAAFVVPYIFALNPALLFMDKMGVIGAVGVVEVVLIILSSILGIFGLAAGLSGYVFKPMKWWGRVLCIIGGLCMMIPGSISDIVGLVLVGGVCVIDYLAAKKTKQTLTDN